MFIRSYSIKKTLVVLVSIFSLNLNIQIAHARFVCLDTFGTNVYLFGDIHSSQHSYNDLTTGEENLEREQLTNIMDNLKTKNEPINVLVEDRFALQGKILKEAPLNSLRFGTLRGLAQRIKSLNKPNIQVSPIEKRFYMGNAFSFFRQGIPFDFTYAPEKVKINKYPNNYSLTFNDLFKEIQQYRDELQIIRNSTSFTPCIRNIIDSNLQQIETSYKELLDYLEKNNIKQNDSMLNKAIELYLSDLHYNFDLTAPQGEQFFQLLKQAFATFANTYPQQQNKQYWKQQMLRIYKINQRIYRQFHSIHEIDSREPIYRHIMQIGILIFDAFAFIDIITNMDKKTVVLFAGALHTQNIKDMLIKAGLEYNKHASTTFWGFQRGRMPSLSKEGLTFPKPAQPATSYNFYGNNLLSHNNGLINAHTPGIHYAKSKRPSILRKLVRSTPAIIVLGAIGTYLLARNNATNSVAGMIIGALSVCTAGGLTWAKIYRFLHSA